MTENFRREPIRSQSYLRGARGQSCVFQIPGVCTNDNSTVVPCHLTDETFGKGRKADDVSIGDGCMACHDAMDGRSIVLSREDWLFYAFRALQRTIRRRIEQKLLILRLDAPSASKPMKPKVGRKPSRPIPSAPFPEQSRPFNHRSEPRVRDINEV